MNGPEAWKERLLALSHNLIASYEASLRDRMLRVQELRHAMSVRLAFQSRPDDVFIVSFPKAGTTAMQMILYQVLKNGGTEFEHIDDVVPWFEVHLRTNPKLLEDMKSPRVFKTHLPLTGLPRNASYVYLFRNAKDTCVSYYHHLRSADGFTGSLATYVKQFISGEPRVTSWYRHLEASCERNGTDRVLVVGYDEIANDLELVIDRVAKFFGCLLDSPRRTLVVDRCRFGSMKRHNGKFDPKRPVVHVPFEKSDFIRSGTVGDWSNHLSPAMADAIDVRAQKVLTKIERRFSAPHMAMLRPIQSLHRGTISIDLDARLVNTALVEPESHSVVYGFRIARNGETLVVGDRVRLHLWWKPHGSAIVTTAVVVSAAESSVELRIESIDTREAGRLSEFCSTSGQPIGCAASRPGLSGASDS